MTGCNTIGVVSRIHTVWKWRSPQDIPREVSMGSGWTDPMGPWQSVVSLLASRAPPKEWPDVRGTSDTMEKAL